MPALVERYQQRLTLIRTSTSAAVEQAWDDLGGYDEADVPTFLARATPVVAAGQAQAANLTDAYIATELNRSPLGLDPALVTGAAVRSGADPEEVYRRPFVQTWTALSKGTRWEDAVAAGRARAGNAAATDIALSSRAAGQVVAARDPRISGWQRVPDNDACKFCRLVAGQRYKREQLMPLHPYCGCTVRPIHRADRGNFTGRRENDPAGVAIHEHGELGPVLTDPKYDFAEL